MRKASRTPECDVSVGAFICLQSELYYNRNPSPPTAGSVLLRDVQVLTLYKGRYTTARRSSPVPQLQCVGGSAGCQAFVPDVVQCQNKGWDGVDVQVRREALGGQRGQRDGVYARGVRIYSHPAL